jgi:hypothetical protein
MDYHIIRVSFPHDGFIAAVVVFIGVFVLVRAIIRIVDLVGV